MVNIPGLFLQGFSAGSVGDVLFDLERLGFFQFILPFLLIFAVVYGILSYMKIFGDQKGIHTVIAVIFGLLAIRLEFFSLFLSEITPRLGVGLAIILMVLILIGLFTPKKSKSTITWILLAVGAIIAIVILVQTREVLGFLGYGGAFSFSDGVISWLIMVGLLIATIVAIVVSKGTEDSGGPSPLYLGSGSDN